MQSLSTLSRIKQVGTVAYPYAQSYVGTHASLHFGWLRDITDHRILLSHSLPNSYSGSFQMILRIKLSSSDNSLDLGQVTWYNPSEVTVTSDGPRPIKGEWSHH